MDEIEQIVTKACHSLFCGKIEAELTRPDSQFGDYSTNAALRAAAIKNKPAGLLANQLAEKLAHDLGHRAAAIKVAGPGFINITLSDSVLAGSLDQAIAHGSNYGANNIKKGQTVVIEHTDPNPFKEFHIGHAYSNTIGEALKRLLEISGAKVHQVSYHGDVGLHIAMAIYGLKSSKNLNKLDIQILGQAYAKGAKTFKDSIKAQKDIKLINQKIYDKSDPEINKLYEAGKKLSFEYFNQLYKTLNVSFEKEYMESEVAPIGLEIVKKHLGKVFSQSDGAVIYKGEKDGLHTRVFTTSQGLPTYETKELGLAAAKSKDFPNADAFIVVTANEIDEYFKVLISALSKIDKTLAGKIKHISHGVVRLPHGKMSSRTGEVITLTLVLEMLEKAVAKIAQAGQRAKGEERSKNSALGPRPSALPNAEDNVLGALKYEFLKHRVGGDIIFDIAGSVNLEGNSGPYLQYAYARANSILHKPQGKSIKTQDSQLGTNERELARKISEYPEVVAEAANELLPNHICTYLYELAQTFNRFYENNRVIGDARQELRIKLVKAYIQTLKNGLSLLNIAAPEKM